MSACGSRLFYIPATKSLWCSHAADFETGLKWFTCILVCVDCCFLCIATDADSEAQSHLAREERVSKARQKVKERVEREGRERERETWKGSRSGSVMEGSKKEPRQ